ncbi:hypothetical protein K445DRAFT_364901, partial [Daldinia sp. EC12]
QTLYPANTSPSPPSIADEHPLCFAFCFLFLVHFCIISSPGKTQAVPAKKKG